MKINIKEFTGKCSCGRDHQLVVDDVILEEGALKKTSRNLKQKNHMISINILLWYVMTTLMRQQEKK